MTLPNRTARLAAAAIIAALPALSHKASADDIAADSTITAVTVFNNQARVTRAASVTIPEGRHRILVPKLPQGLDREAFEVSLVTATGSVSLGAVDLRTVEQEDLVNLEEEELVVELERLAFARREQEDAIEAEEMVIEIIENIGKAIADRTADSLAADLPRPERWSETWVGLKEGAATSLARIRLAEREIARLELQEDQIERQLEQIRTGARATVSVDIEVIAETPSDGLLQLSYLVPDARWNPVYEARLSTGASSLAWNQLASVTQGTGEDWSDVSLTLSTARPGAAAPLPELSPWFIDVVPPDAPAALARSEAADLAIAPSLAMAAPTPVLVQSSTFQTEYTVPDPVSVPSTRETYRVTLAQSELAAELETRAIPKFGLEPQIYATSDYEGDAPLLAGPLVLYRDGTYVGRHRIGATAPGDSLDLAFGPDDLVDVQQIFVTGSRDRQGIIRDRRRHERRYRIEVTNHHDIAMPITVLEQLPVPQDTRIEVDLLDDATPPTATDYDGRTGVLAWSFDYAPGESRTLTFAYAVTHPADIEVTGF